MPVHYDFFILGLTNQYYDSRTLRKVCGILGTIKLISGQYLVVATHREFVGVINNQVVWRLAGHDLIPYIPSLIHLSDTQVCDSHWMHLKTSCSHNIFAFFPAESSKWNISIDDKSYVEYAVLLLLVYLWFVTLATEVEHSGAFFLWGKLKINRIYSLKLKIHSWFHSVGHGRARWPSIHLERTFAQRFSNCTTQAIQFTTGSWMYVFWTRTSRSHLIQLDFFPIFSWQLFQLTKST